MTRKFKKFTIKLRWPYHLVTAFFHRATSGLFRHRTRQLHWDYRTKGDRRGSAAPLLHRNGEQSGGLLNTPEAEASSLHSRNSSVCEEHRSGHSRSGSAQEHNTLGIPMQLLHPFNTFTRQHFQDPQLNLPIFTGMMHDSESQEKTTGTWPHEPPPDQSSGPQRSMLMPRASYSRRGSLDPQLDAPEPTH